MYEDGRMETSCCKTIHWSDTLRLAVLYRLGTVRHSVLILIIRYGGLYSDLDTVTIASTVYLDNVVAWAGSFVSNAQLLFRRGHPFLLRLMEEADERFTGQGWNSVGPVMLTETIKRMCQTQKEERSTSCEAF